MTAPVESTPASPETLSVIIPIYNERNHIGGTLQAAAAVIAQSGFDAEFVVVDDGSTDGSAEVVRATALAYPVRIIRQHNQGRVPARKAGLAAASGAYSLFLDSRVRLEPGGLSYIAERLPEGARVWNAHVEIDSEGNPYGKFWKVLVRLFWGDYLDQPRTTSFGLAEFDRYPKGTTGFLAPTDLLRAGFASHDSYFEDERYAADDTPAIRRIAEHERVHISPRFACTYRPRRTLDGFVRQAFFRGIFFVDGHGRRESRLFPAVVAFYPLSVLGLLAALKRPRLAAAAAVAGVVATGAYAASRGVKRDEAVAFAALTPLYGLVHGAGMWRALGLLLAKRRGRR
ncbi:MAG TPA: glycosyltransferase family 2 protein [Candidatus Dormibacteraeota bacterium]